MIAVGRFINGITINPLEYLLEEEGGDIKKFDDKTEAYIFLKTFYPDASDTDLEDSFMFEEV